MSLDSDVIVDRRRIRRKLTFWRVAAAVVALAAVVTVGMIASPVGRASLISSGSIARINIEGLIRSDQQRVEALEQLEKSADAAVIVHINSPGGTTAGSEQLYDALVRLKAKKPVVVVVEGLAASGGYITAIAADHIVAAGSDAYGYVSQVDLWLQGHLHIDQSFGASVPWPMARWTFTPVPSKVLIVATNWRRLIRRPPATL